MTSHLLDLSNLIVAKLLCRAAGDVCKFTERGTVPDNFTGERDGSRDHYRAPAAAKFTPAREAAAGRVAPLWADVSGQTCGTSARGDTEVPAGLAPAARTGAVRGW